MTLAELINKLQQIRAKNKEVKIELIDHDDGIHFAPIYDVRESHGEITISGVPPQCPEPEILNLLSLGNLPPSKAKRWVDHVDGCKSCGDTLRFLRRKKPSKRKLRRRNPDIDLDRLTGFRRRRRRNRDIDLDRLTGFRRRNLDDEIDLDRLTGFRRRNSDDEIDLDRLTGFRRRKWRRNPAPDGSSWGPDLYNPLEDKNHNFTDDSHYRKLLSKLRRNPLPGFGARSNSRWRKRRRHRGA